MTRPAAKPAVSSAASPRGLTLAYFAVLAVLALVAYGPALRGDFLWDDGGHVTRPDLRSLGGLFRIWFEVGATQQYYPVLHSAFWLEHKLWGDSVAGYHVLNVLLHSLAATQLWLVLRRLALPGACLASFIFLLHPVCVESVAWISEQKNTLSLVFYLGTALAYLRFESGRGFMPRSDSGDAGSRGMKLLPHTTGRRYAIATALFVLALLTKTVTASLPAALLVVFWWQRGSLSFRRDVVPLLPWFGAAIASGLFTAHFERVLIGAQGQDFGLGFLERLLLSGRVFWFYLGSFVWPVNLTFIYPRWTIDAAAWMQWLPLAAGLALLGALVWRSRRQRGPLAAALLFAGGLFPVLGFFNVYPFLFSYVADHFQYLPTLALCALAGYGLTQLAGRLPSVAGNLGFAVILAGLGVLTWFQCGMYRDPVKLYETTLQRNPAAWMAHNNLGILLSGENRFEDAVAHLRTALELKPDYAPAANNLGYALFRLERPTEAVPALERALQLKPDYAIAHRNLGTALAMLGRNAEALTHFETALRLDPNDGEAEMNQGIALMLLNRFPEAVPHFERAVALAPDSAEPCFTYGRALAYQGRLADAARQFEAAVARAPQYAEAHFELAQIYSQLGRREDAQRHLATAHELNPALK